ncbi:hypothetical protein HBA55_34840 [Pseudomaricurvus alkylphenolicus]|uniref:hypothetical protein n=1 Tax=Pseudomaricurvus alkylphenolicus TaxID=1306991 RepID=UPI0014222545|nr:hypothetical protein [Pseudomaricurvus alkylphenolicus]NIB44810.1 hypothetical protein [Pseudomaricurvus alkylphenolicus]
MNIFKPIAITSVTSNVPEDDYPAWVSDNDPGYAQGERAISPATHRIYESLIPGNLGNDPDDRDNHSDKWLDVSATNLHKMFDGKLADQTTHEGEISVTIVPGVPVDSLALINLSAASFRAQVVDPVDGPVFDETVQLIDNSGVVDWSTYVSTKPKLIKDAALFNLPRYSAASITITISSVSGPVAVGELALGAKESLGDLKLGADVGIADYSKIAYDDFGNATVNKRGFSRKIGYPISLPSKHFHSALHVLESYRSTPMIYSGRDDGGGGFLTYGYYYDFRLLHQNKVYSHCDLKVRSLV